MPRTPPSNNEFGDYERFEWAFCLTGCFLLACLIAGPILFANGYPKRWYPGLCIPTKYHFEETKHNQFNETSQTWGTRSTWKVAWEGSYRSIDLPRIEGVGTWTRPESKRETFDSQELANRTLHQYSLTEQYKCQLYLGEGYKDLESHLTYPAQTVQWKDDFTIFNLKTIFGTLSFAAAGASILILIGLSLYLYYKKKQREKREQEKEMSHF